MCILYLWGGLEIMLTGKDLDHYYECDLKDCVLCNRILGKEFSVQEEKGN